MSAKRWRRLVMVPVSVLVAPDPAGHEPAGLKGQDDEHDGNGETDEVEGHQAHPHRHVEERQGARQNVTVDGRVDEAPGPDEAVGRTLVAKRDEAKVLDLGREHHAREHLKGTGDDVCIDEGEGDEAGGHARLDHREGAIGDGGEDGDGGEVDHGAREEEGCPHQDGVGLAPLDGPARRPQQEVGQPFGEERQRQHRRELDALARPARALFRVRDLMLGPGDEPRDVGHDGRRIDDRAARLLDAVREAGEEVGALGHVGRAGGRAPGREEGAELAHQRGPLARVLEGGDEGLEVRDRHGGARRPPVLRPRGHRRGE